MLLQQLATALFWCSTRVLLSCEAGTISPGTVAGTWECSHCCTLGEGAVFNPICACAEQCMVKNLSILLGEVDIRGGVFPLVS